MSAFKHFSLATIALLHIAMLMASGASAAAEPVPQHVPTAYVDGRDIVVEMAWSYSQQCVEGRGAAYVRVGDPIPGIDGLAWIFEYGLFGFDPRGCRPESRQPVAGSSRYVWRNLAPGPHRVTVSYVDSSSGLDCGFIVPPGCPLPEVTRTFVFDLIVPISTVPTLSVTSHYVLVLLLTVLAGFGIRRRDGAP